jgi:hypothetical protein
MHAILLSRQQRAGEAASILQRVLAASTKMHGPESVETAAHETSLVCALVEAGRLHAAEPHAAHARDVTLWLLGKDHPKTQVAILNHAGVLIGVGRAAEAEATLRDLVAVRKEQLGPAHPYTLLAQRYLARALAAQQRFDEAEAVLAGALGHLAGAGAEAAVERLDLQLEAADVAAKAGRTAEAARRLAELQGAPLSRGQTAFLERVRKAVAEAAR